MTAEKYGAAPESEHTKRVSTLRARAALAGVVIHVIEGDSGETLYIFSRWELCRQLDSIEAAERWLDAMTGCNK